MTRFRAGFVGGILCILELGATSACQKPVRVEAASAPTDAVKAPARSTEAAVVSTGTLRLKTGAEVRVGAQISGLVKKLNVSVGAHIAKGDVIAVIDSRGFEERVAQARSQIRVDQAQIQKLRRQSARSQRLLEVGLVPQRDAEDLEDDVLQAEARLDKSRSDLRLVESDRPYLTLRAPIAGTVASVSTQQGETVAASFSAPTFVTIIGDDALELVAMVDETDIGNVVPSSPVTFTTETYPSKDFHGIVERIAPKATILSGVVNYEVAIRIRGDPAGLKPDMTANVTIRTENAPRAGVTHDPSTPSVQDAPKGRRSPGPRIARHLLRHRAR